MAAALWAGVDEPTTWASSTRAPDPGERSGCVISRFPVGLHLNASRDEIEHIARRMRGATCARQLHAKVKGTANPSPEVFAVPLSAAGYFPLRYRGAVLTPPRMSARLGRPFMPQRELRQVLSYSGCRARSNTSRYPRDDAVADSLRGFQEISQNSFWIMPQSKKTRDNTENLALIDAHALGVVQDERRHVSYVPGGSNDND